MTLIIDIIKAMCERLHFAREALVSASRSMPPILNSPKSLRSPFPEMLLLQREAAPSLIAPVSRVAWPSQLPLALLM